MYPYLQEKLLFGILNCKNKNKKLKIRNASFQQFQITVYNNEQRAEKAHKTHEDMHVK